MLSMKRMPRIFQRLSDVVKLRKPGDKLGVQGWIQNIRRLKNNIFLDISDGSTSTQFQVVVPKNDVTKAITWGSSIRATGCIQVAPNGNFELNADDVNVIADGNLSDGYPFTPKQQHPPEYVREHLHLRARVNNVGAQMRVRHRAQKCFHDFLDAAGFIQIDTPIITTNDCEGAGEVFVVKPDSETLLKEMQRPDIPRDASYFDQKVYLSVSGQLHLEAMSYGLGNTYTLSPAFRAENSKSPLHLSEFHMLEAELAFLDEMIELTSFIENMLKDVTMRILDENAEDLRYCQRNSTGQVLDFAWLKHGWTTLTYDEASKIILDNKSKFNTEVNPSEGFSKEQEMFLVAHCASPVFVVNWPAAQKPFYMKVTRENADRVHALDLLMPVVGELCGGSLRESDVNRLAEHPRLPNNLEWYLQLRKFGGLPTGGFGMGFERYLQLLTGVKNIRDVIPFPRYPHSCKM